MNPMHDLLIAHLGTPYIFGGNNPMTGMDCSGFACWFLKSLGVINQDMSAQMLFDYFSNAGAHQKRALGALLFFGRSVTDIGHVGIVYNQHLMVEAGGGDSKTKTIEIAKQRDACIRIRPIASRRDLISTIYPNYSSIGFTY